MMKLRLSEAAAARLQTKLKESRRIISEQRGLLAAKDASDKARASLEAELKRLKGQLQGERAARQSRDEELLKWGWFWAKLDGETQTWVKRLQATPPRRTGYDQQ